MRTRKNVGQRKLNEHGKLPDMDARVGILPDEKSMVTTFSFGVPVMFCQITHDNWVEDTFQVHTEVRMVKF